MNAAIGFLAGYAAGTATTFIGALLVTRAAKRRRQPTEHLDSTAIVPDTVDRELARIIRESAL